MVKVAFMQGSDCWGCHQSLLDNHLGLLPVLPALEFVYWPAVVDFKLDSLKARPDGDVLVGFCEGSLRTQADIENAKLMRQKCALIIAFGSCACYGNVHGMANQWSVGELTDRKFNTVESKSSGGGTPTQHVPPFTEKLVPTDAVIKVDAYMSGCPPRPEQIVSAVAFLLGQKPFPMNDLAYCNDCAIKDACLLDKDVLCFGPITSMGCATKCTSAGNPCVGCMGPSKTVAGQQVKQLTKMTKKLGKISSGDKKTLFEFLTLFLNLPLMAGFDLAGDILKQIKIKGKVNTPLANLPEDTEKIASNALEYLKDNRDFTKLSNVCDTCSRRRGVMQMTDVKRDYQGLPNEEDCLIEQGYICLGPVTKAGCGGLCPRVNAPCSGCYGQTAWVKDQAERYADVVTSGFNVALSKKELLEKVKDPIGTFEKFTLAANKDYKGGN